MQRVLSAPDLDFDAVRTELGVSEDYGVDAQAEAEHPVDRCAADRADRTDLPLVTIDPPTSMDLDQAVHIAADTDGFVISYAIADVAALVEPERALDQESRRRGTTFYFPDRSVPLHPRALSEGAGSLLPDHRRPAVLWTIRVTPDGSVADVTLGRAAVWSVAKLDYAGVSEDAARGRLHPSITALPAFGELRQRVALERGAVELDLPDQEVTCTDRGWMLRLAPHTPADMWNSQLSLLTGMCAGRIMADAGVGLLRTLPPADADAVVALRASAAALGVPWPAGATPGQFLAGLPRDSPATLALMSAGAGLMRGADHLVLDGGTGQLSAAQMSHAAIGGVYAHVTAPLRRLGDRFATEVCLSVTAGDPVPDWVTRALPTLPTLLRSAGSLASAADRAGIDLAEATVLAGRVGETFDAVVLQAATPNRPAQVFLTEVPVIAPCAGDPPLGRPVQVVLRAADPPAREVRFEFVADAG
ncbi:RNB domain-containing ribonuclease [Gordonia sp. HNM0687]|uniref:RNB domain-containing ribonuclease n=1 Tax=Gordonia mangrovi TaxID=2665643 RepID=A0A6L7GNU5_9ACTN|nr:RNB domain-containing ribonuclease [Gordonia mangrovi]MXP21047.1 RNB domain-containing ribonuclease [Gordonia mangrovi]UVF78409.1 RNB domain-containing ribonuclease [Gordonia mangrovi]